MLLADKLDLQNKLKLNMLQIEERELNYYTQNALTMGTQAALLAGFAFTGIVEADWEYLQSNALSNTHPWVSSCAAVATLLAMLFEVLAVVKSVQVSILGPGLALRGSEGSMTRALSVMKLEHRRLHWQFYIGLIFFFVAAAFFCVAIFDTAVGVLCVVVTVLFFGWLALDVKYVHAALWLPPAQSLYAARPPARPRACGPTACGPTRPPARLRAHARRRWAPCTTLPAPFPMGSRAPHARAPHALVPRPPPRARAQSTRARGL